MTGQHHHRRANRIHHVGHGRDARASCGSTQDARARRLLKIGAAVLRNTRRLRVMLAGHHPLRELFALAAERLAALGP